MKHIALWAIVICAFPFSFLHAEGPVIRSGDSVTVEASQAIRSDFYALGENVILSGEVEHDMHVLGAKITINAPIGEDLTAIGGAIDVHGSVGDDVRILGGDVIIAEPVLGDLVVASGKVTITSTGSVKGDVVFYGSELLVDGPVTGTLFGSAEKVNLNASVGGNIDMRIGNTLTLGDRSEVVGNVTYRSAHELVRAPNAVIRGTTTRHADTYEEVSSGNPYVFVLMNLLVVIFSGLTFFFLFRPYTGRIVESVFGGYGRFGLIGLGMFLALPLMALICMVSGIGAFVGGALLLSYGVLVFLSCMSVPLLLGASLQRALRLGSAYTLFTVLLGSCALIGLLFIPVIGFLALMVVFLMSLGGMCVLVYRSMKGDLDQVVLPHEGTHAS